MTLHIILTLLKFVNVLLSPQLNSITHYEYKPENN